MTSLYGLKPWYTARLSGLVRLAQRRRLSPDVFTAAGVAGAAGAGLALATGHPLLGAALLAVRLAGANLDGAVARARQVSRPWGAVLNELGDRASDLLVFAGLAVLAAPVDRPLLLVAALAATLPTTAALAVAAAGGSRRNGGPLGKTERCVLAVVVGAVPAWLPAVCVLLVVGSTATAAARLAAGARELAPVPA